MKSKLAISNIAWENERNEEIYILMEKYGFTGLEIAPTKWIVSNPYDNIPKASEIAENLKKEYNFEIPSMQSIWYGRKEKLFGTEEERMLLLEYTKKAIDFARAIGCSNLVFGSPKNRNIEEENEGKEQAAIDFFQKLGDYAGTSGIALSMEANPRIYNTNYINRTEEAIRLVKKVASKGFKVNLDVGTMIENKECVEVIEDNIRYINHIHISEPNLEVIRKRKLHRELAEAIRKEAYKGYISIEMGRCDDINVIESVMCYVREIFG